MHPVELRRSPRNKPHRFWRNRELVDMVFCYAFTRGKEDLPALAPMARISKFVGESALNMVWAHLDNTEPLLECLGREPWGYCDESIQSHLDNPLEREGLSRFEYYSSRVITLGVERRRKPSSVPEVVTLRTHWMLALSTPFLPKLKTLYWDKSLGPLQTFLSPKIKTLSHLSIELQDLDDMDLGILASMGDAGSCITSLTFPVSHSLPTSPRLHVPYISKCLGQLKSLQHFQSDSNLPSRVYTRLAAISSLRSISLNLEHQEDIIHEIFNGPNPFAFSNLEALRLVVDDFVDLMTFIHATPLASVRDIDVQVFKIADPHTLRDFVSHLKDHRKSNHLASLILQASVSGFEPGDMHYGILLPDDIRPLLSFQKLRHLTLDAWDSFQMDDQMLEEMALSWPSLETLCLGSRYGWQGHSQCTWTGFVALLHRCCNLRKVAIALRTTEGCSSNEILPGFVRHNSLIQLDFLDSPIYSCPMQVAMFLSDLSFKLSDIRAWGDTVQVLKGEECDERIWSSGWRQVQFHLEEFMKVRGVERRRSSRQN